MRSIAALLHQREPAREPWIPRHVVTDHGLTGADDLSPWTASAWVVRVPRDRDFGEIPLLHAGVGHRRNRTSLIVLGIPDPRHPVAAGLHRDLADFIQQVRFVCRPDQ